MRVLGAVILGIVIGCTATDAHKGVESIPEIRENIMSVKINTMEFEGFRDKVYYCSSKKKTVGYGHNMERAISKRRFLQLGIPYYDVLDGKRRITTSQALELFYLDMEDAIIDAKRVISNYVEHPKVVRNAIVDMVFNMGVTEFKKFKNLIKALEDKNYKQAAWEIKYTGKKEGQLTPYYTNKGAQPDGHRRPRAIIAALLSVS